MSHLYGETPFPTCPLCGAYSIFTMTSAGKVWEQGCRCADRREQERRQRQLVAAGAAIVSLSYQYVHHEPEAGR